jgi:hypothetical protein
MEGKPRIVSLKDEVMLSIEDIKEQASKKLPNFARGEVLLSHHRQ